MKKVISSILLLGIFAIGIGYALYDTVQNQALAGESSNASPSNSKNLGTELEEKDWSIYENDTLHISFRYPSSWHQMDVGEYEPIRYEGENGFFEVTSIIANSVDAPGEVTPLNTVCEEYAFSKFDPYGTEPTIEEVTIQEQNGCIILPSDDQREDFDQQTAFILEYPQPVEVDGIESHYFLLYATQDYIHSMVHSLSLTME
ncbi:hypothetical protein [Aquibacillus sediminis]|uniref:hypothetical protein n=1 Tax=Aquibacillus sediminis TaxID=2574734 RepID=UPI0011086EAD|nr:hypothetical protein [Aquibacillus sediminis]